MRKLSARSSSRSKLAWYATDSSDERASSAFAVIGSASPSSAARATTNAPSCDGYAWSGLDRMGRLLLDQLMFAVASLRAWNIEKNFSAMVDASSVALP